MKFINYRDIYKEDIFGDQYPLASIKSDLLSYCKDTSDSDHFDIFLSHSYKDARIITAIKEFLQSLQYSIYVDWIEDKELDRNRVTPATANRLRIRMRNSKSLFIIASEYSKKSHWIPWEIGYFDADKSKLAILPIGDYDRDAIIDKIEFLGLYPFVYIDIKIDDSNWDKIWIGFNTTETERFRDWLLN